MLGRITKVATFFMRGLQIFCATHFLMCETKEKGDKVMNDYKEMYFELFNKITDIIESLKTIQQEMEEKYIENEKVSE